MTRVSNAITKEAQPLETPTARARATHVTWVADRHGVLGVYACPYDPAYPVVVMADKPL